MTTVFFDVDTQIDFLYPAGALYVKGAERIVPAIARLNAHAAAHGSIVISSVDAHGEEDPEFRQWPAHCVSGTAGQGKPASTLLEKRMTVRNVAGPIDLVGAQQIILEKQTLDVFETRTIRDVLAQLNADRYIVYGVVTEHCVRFAAEGLLRTGKPVEVVTDAIEALDAAASRRMLEAFTVAGGTLTTVERICG